MQRGSDDRDGDESEADGARERREIEEQAAHQ
jgi:hypothetical protein